MFKQVVLSAVGTLALLGALGFGVALADPPAQGELPPAEPPQELAGVEEVVDWFTVAAETIGLDEDALWEALEDGQSIAEIAQAHGVEPQAVIDAVVAAEKEFVDRLVAEGELTQEEADEWLAELDEEVRAFVEETFGDITVELAP